MAAPRLGWRVLLCSALMLSGLAAQAVAQENYTDLLSIGSSSGKAGAVVRLPVTLKDEIGHPFLSWLGADAGTGKQIQALALQVTWLPENAVHSISFERSGVLKNLTPIYEAQLAYDKLAGYVVSFDEAAQPILGLVDGAEILNLKVLLSPAAKAGQVVSIYTLPEQSLIANQKGDVTERCDNESLRAHQGSIRVTQGLKKPVLSLQVLTPTVLEGQRIKLKITASRKTSAALRVKLAWSGSAKLGRDYRVISRTLSIPAGKRALRVLLAAKKDKLAEGDESIAVALKKGRGYLVIPPFNGTVTLRDPLKD